MTVKAFFYRNADPCRFVEGGGFPNLLIVFIKKVEWRSTAWLTQNNITSRSAPQMSLDTWGRGKPEASGGEGGERRRRRGGGKRKNLRKSFSEDVWASRVNEVPI